MRTKFETADKILDHQYLSGDVLGGFNARLFGDSYNDACGYPHPAFSAGKRSAGWQKADELIRSGEIYYHHIFSHGDCDGASFNYGGTHVCNSCGRRDLKKPWWSVRVFMDGNAWCVVGEGFENLQASDNYAFGDTRDQALSNYQELMEGKTNE